MESNDQKVKQITVCFLRSNDLLEEDLMQKSFDLIDLDINFNNQWLDSNQLMATDIQPNTNSIFVVNSFFGKEFEYLCRRKATIIGPLVILHPILTLKQLFLKSYPILSRCMSGSVVAISLNDNLRKPVLIDELIQKIKLMDGKYSLDITKKVTHLVTNNLRLKQYSKAVENGITIVSEDWVNHCWDQLQYQLIRADDQTVVQSFEWPAFQKVFTRNRVPIIVIKKELNENNDYECPANDGLDWIYNCDSLTDDSQIECPDNDGLDWIYSCESLRPDVSTTNQSNVSIDEPMPLKTKCETKAKTTEQFVLPKIVDPFGHRNKIIKIEVHNSLGDRLNQLSHIKWNDRAIEFEGMPSQMPYN